MKIVWRQSIFIYIFLKSLAWYQKLTRLCRCESGCTVPQVRVRSLHPSAKTFPPQVLVFPQTCKKCLLDTRGHTSWARHGLFPEETNSLWGQVSRKWDIPDAVITQELWGARVVRDRKWTTKLPNFPINCSPWNSQGKHFEGFHKKKNLTQWKFSKDLFSKRDQVGRNRGKKEKYTLIYRWWELKRLKMLFYAMGVFIVSNLGSPSWMPI